MNEAHTLWPPVRTATFKPFRRAKRTASITSVSFAACTISGGRRAGLRCCHTMALHQPGQAASPLPTTVPRISLRNDALVVAQ